MSQPAPALIANALAHDLAGVALYSRAAFSVPKGDEPRWRWLKAKTEETWFWACELRTHADALGWRRGPSSRAAEPPEVAFADLPALVVGHETRGMRVFADLLAVLPPAALR